MPRTESITPIARGEEQDGEDTLSLTGPRALREPADMRSLTPQLHILDHDEGILLGGMCYCPMHTYDTLLTDNVRIQSESLSEKGGLSMAVHLPMLPSGTCPVFDVLRRYPYPVASHRTHHDADAEVGDPSFRVMRFLTFLSGLSLRTRETTTTASGSPCTTLSWSL